MRHFRFINKFADWIVSPVLIGVFAVSAFAQRSPPGVELTENDAAEISSCFKTINAKDAVESFRKKMPPPVIDPKLREQIIDNLPAQVAKLRIQDEKLETKVRNLLAPILNLYDRTKYYEIIVINHQTPLVFSDSGVVLVITTGLLSEAASDDEIFGYVAHEVGHEYFAQYSIYTKYLLSKVKANGQEIPINRRLYEMLALIELECDAFAAITLISLDYDPLAFIDGLERTAKNYPTYSAGFHPPESIRRKVIQEIAQTRTETGTLETGKSRISKRSISPQLQEIKSYLNLNYSKPLWLIPTTN